jgi:DNA-binding LacI/PurR family transcriptional regulator
MPQVTLREIADKVGCSRSTVSYALRNNPSISVALRQKIQETALTLGWIPDAELQHQMELIRTTTKRRDLPNLGLVSFRPPAQLQSNQPIYKAHIDGIRERATELGFAVDFFDLATNPLSAKRLSTVMESRGIRGVLFVDFDLTVPTEYWSLASSFAAISVGVDHGHSEMNAALVNYLSLGRRMVSELRALGFHRPGVVLPRTVEILMHGSYTGGISAGIFPLPAADKLPIYYCGDAQDTSLPASEYPEFRAWLDQHRPDVIIAIDAGPVRDCLDATPNHAALSVFTLAWPSAGAVGGIDQRHADLGRAAVDLLVSQINRRELGLPKVPKSILVHEEWVAPQPGSFSPPKSSPTARETSDNLAPKTLQPEVS